MILIMALLLLLDIKATMMKQHLSVLNVCASETSFVFVGSGVATGGLGEFAPPPTFAKVVLEISIKSMRK